MLLCQNFCFFRTTKRNRPTLTVVGLVCSQEAPPLTPHPLENDSVPSASHPTFASVDEDTWRSAVAKAEQPLEKTINGLRFSAINTSSDLPPPAPHNQTKSPPRFGTLEVTLPTPLSPALRKTLLATQASGWKINPPDLSTLLTWHSANQSLFARLSIEPTEPDFDLSDYLAYLREQPGTSTSGAIYLPLAHLNYWQTDSPDLPALNELTHETSDLVNLSTITVRGDQFGQWGAPATDELALTLSWWVAYCDQLTDLGLSIETILARTELSLSTDADYFIGLAKFRALRYLIVEIAQAYGVVEDAAARPRVRAVSGLRNKTYYDPDVNLLRNTTEALTSLLGGVDTLALVPHDFLSASPDPFGIRMVSNTYQILRHEAQLGKVADPAAGSYFIENLTGQLVEKGWQQFLAWEDQGGFIKLLKGGTLEAHCRAPANQAANAFRTHRRVLVGATRYGNAPERSSEPFNTSIDRDALPFERIRNTIDQRVAQGQARPLIGVVVQPGNAVANQRKNYVRDALVCLGVTSQEFPPNELSESVDTPPLIAIVFCGTDAYYQTTVIDALRNHPNAPYPCWIAGGSDETIQQVRQAGGDGVLGIGHDLIALIEPLLNPWMHET